MTESISEDDKLAVEQFVVVLYDQVLQNTLMKPDWICLHGNRKHMKRYPHLSSSSGTHLKSSIPSRAFMGSNFDLRANYSNSF